MVAKSLGVNIGAPGFHFKGKPETETAKVPSTKTALEHEPVLITCLVARCVMCVIVTDGICGPWAGPSGSQQQQLAGAMRQVPKIC